MLDRKKIVELKEQGKSYREIATLLNIPLGSVKGICSIVKHQSPITYCKFCGKPIKLTKHKREKKFCSDNCRQKWWTSHKNLIKKKTFRVNTCKFCGKTFIGYGNRERFYCCRDHYDRARQANATILKNDD